MLRANPDQMAMLKQNNPKLSEALESGDLEAFAKVSINSRKFGIHIILSLCEGTPCVQVLKEQQDARKEREQMRIRFQSKL